MMNQKENEPCCREGKRVEDSLTVQVQVVQQQDINGYKRLFGGQLMAWMDIVAGVVGRRHSGRQVTTAVVDELQFLAPAFIDDIIIITGRVTHVGRTSIEVRVDVAVEVDSHNRRPINRAYFVLVGIDEKGKPAEVPSLILETEEERLEWAQAEKRKSYRQKKRAEEKTEG